jgi:hypothetical protein
LILLIWVNSSRQVLLRYSGTEHYKCSLLSSFVSKLNYDFQNLWFGNWFEATECVRLYNISYQLILRFQFHGLCLEKRTRFSVLVCLDWNFIFIRNWCFSWDICITIVEHKSQIRTFASRYSVCFAEESEKMNNETIP